MNYAILQIPKQHRISIQYWIIITAFRDESKLAFIKCLQAVIKCNFVASLKPDPRKKINLFIVRVPMSASLISTAFFYIEII